MIPLPADTLPPPPVTLLNDAALFLDFDGTLVELADSPDGVDVPDSLLQLLDCLVDLLDGRLAIVSGRNCVRLEQFGLGRFLRVGSHGLEISGPDQTICMPERHGALDGILEAARAFANDKPGVVIEAKPYSVGIHYRQAPQFGEVADALADRLAATDGLLVQKGKLMAEIRPTDGNKGKAVERLMESARFRGHAPVFLGDDKTDEDGFETAAALGGHGIFVGREGRTAAHWRIGDVDGVRSWLARCCTLLERGRAKA